MARILIVDDEDNIRFTLVKTLQAEGHETFEASDGEFAQDILDKHDVDLVITDILMPNREGLETIKMLRESRPEIRIIAMSGGGRLHNTNFLKAAKQFGADLVLKKPFSMADLRNEVAEILDNPRRAAK